MARKFSSPRRTVATILAALILAGPALMGGPSQGHAQVFTCPSPGFGVVPPGLVPPGGVAAVPPLLLTSLRKVVNPVLGVADPLTGLPQLDANGMPVQALRGDLTDYVANLKVAIQLGKALFWDMQAGSDNMTACATCHFQAGADVRTRNQINPGPNTTFDLFFGANGDLASFLPAAPMISPAYDDIAGSQGVRASTFVRVSNGVETTNPPIPTGFRQVTGKNTPSAVNAVFNHRNFWNGRAQPEFNGVNPWGNRDASARVWVTVDTLGNVGQIDIHIQTASLASQAVGPPLNPVEMSAAGRAFPDLGKKLLALKPLGLQKVDRNDSVLGSLADQKGKGLSKATYVSLIQKAFQPKWWNTTKTVSIATPTGTRNYSLMEANFSLFWGLSIMLYEATLASDDTPMDQYLASRVLAVDSTGFPYVASDNAGLLDPVVTRLQTDFPGLTRADILTGLALFELPLPAPVGGGPVPNPFPLPNLASGPVPTTATYNPNLVFTFGVGCSACHFPGELTSASVRNLAGHGLEPGDAVLKNMGFDLRMERMFMRFPQVPLGTDMITFDPSTYTVTVNEIIPFSPVSPPWDPVPLLPFQAPTATYDAGWYNIGVRPTAEDLGVGDVGGPGPLPLSWTRLFQTILPDPTIIDVPGSGLPCATLGNVNFPFTAVNAAGFPLLSGPLLKNEPTDVAGSFKTPGLRNVELNGPYFHNGGKSTLAQVLDFYDSGGNFGTLTNPTKAPALVPLNLTPDEQTALVAFLLALTDDRVRYQRAPFDHPELVVPAGQDSNGNDLTTALPAVGAAGSTTPLQRFLNLNPFQP